MEAKKRKSMKIWLTIAFVLLFVGILFFVFSGDNKKVLDILFKAGVTKEEVHESLDSLGWKAYISVSVLSMLQVVFTFLPAEPTQVIAGVSFGFWKGALICTAGILVGNTVIFILHKIYGAKLSGYFEKNLELDFSIASQSKKIVLFIFLLYFLPAIPYGLICFFAASLNWKYPKYIIVTVLGAIPSVLIGVSLGHLAIASSWVLSLAVFFVLVALLVVMYVNKKKIFAAFNEYMRKKSLPYSSKTTVKKKSSFFYRFIVFTCSFFLRFNIKYKVKNEVGKLERPAIVLCNHGSFIDFLYAGLVLRKARPRYVTARMYFYRKDLAWFLRKLGCFPKSMFSADMENAKNCLRVLSLGETLVLFPEARLSTAGKFEGIQESTYKFIHKAGVPVYHLHLSGNYLAKPKWGDKIRRRALVEGTLTSLFTKEELSTLSMQEVQTKIDNALSYDEFAWLETRPNLRYKSKTLAEGLENILCVCPECRAKYSMKTRFKTISCEKCGFERTLDERYAFTNPLPFANFSKWYDWQTEAWKEECDKEDFSMESEVILKHASLDGKKCLREVGRGVCKLNHLGLFYQGTKEGKPFEKCFPLPSIYRILFGAGEDFELYEGNEIYYFEPKEKRMAVAFYIASGLLK